MVEWGGGTSPYSTLLHDLVYSNIRLTIFSYLNASTAQTLPIYSSTQLVLQSDLRDNPFPHNHPKETSFTKILLKIHLVPGLLLF